MSESPRFVRRLCKTRRETLALVEGLTQQQIDFSSSPRKWSTGQVLDHLTRVDEVFHEDCDELLARWRKSPGRASLFRSLSDSGLKLPLVPDAFLPLFDIPAAMAGVFVPRQLRQTVLSSRAVPAQAPERIRPRKGRPVEDLRRELAEFVDYLEARVAENPEVDWQRLRYYNPLFGFTNLPGFASTVISHEKRHQEQIREVLGARGFPAAG